MYFTTTAERQDFMEWLKESLLQIACRLLMIRDVEGWAKQVISQERGFSRALTSGNSLTLSRSVFGEPVQICLSDWITQEEDPNYDVLRDTPWKREKAKNTGDPRNL